MISFSRWQRSHTVLALLLLPGFAAPLDAQVVGGTLAGRVTDSTGAIIRNASVVIENHDTGQARELKTNQDGSFAAPSLPAGSYAVEAKAAGFANYKNIGIDLATGQRLELNIRLEPSGSQSITVHSRPSGVDLSTEETSGLVGSKQVKQLPLNGRSLDQLLTLSSQAINYTNQRSGGTGTSNSSVGNMFSIAGRRPQDNLFLLNGIEYTGASLINNTPGGTSGQLLGVDGIKEFNVVSGTYSAAYGKRSGAQISIVTSSGTNQLHGSIYEFLRNSALDTRNYFDAKNIPEFQRNNFGASLGGPLRRNKAFLFGNYEGYRQNLGESIVALVPDNASRAAAAASVKPLLNLWPIANGPEVLTNGVATGVAKWIGTAPQKIREDFGTTRFDQTLSSTDNYSVIYTIDDSTANSPAANPYSYIDEALREQVLSAQEQHLFAKAVNVVRFGFSRASFHFDSYVPSEQQSLAPSIRSGVPSYAVVIAGSTASNGASSLTAAGSNVGSNNSIARNLFTFDDHAYYTVGNHTIEAGVWIQRLQSNDNLAQDQYGQAAFASLNTFLAGNVKTFTYAPKTTELGWRALFVNAFIEDTYRVTPRLELRLGLRSQSSTGWSESQGRAGIYTFTNGIINTEPIVVKNALTKNHASFLPEPRAALAWNVFGSGRTSLKIGAGLHHTLLDSLDYRLDQAAPFNTVYSYSSTTVAAPVSGTPRVSPSTADAAMRTPALLAYSLKIEQQLVPGTVLSLGYEGFHSYHQILNGDLNEPSFIERPDGRLYYPNTTRANPAVANTTSWWSGGSGSYNALNADLRHSGSRGLYYGVSYTWSKNLDDGSAWNTSVSSNTPAYVSVPSRPHLDYGPAATDIRNAAALYANYALPFGKDGSLFANSKPLVQTLLSGWSFSSIVNVMSGFPFSPQLGYNPTGSGDSRNPVRPNWNPAYHGSLYTHGSTAERATRYFHPQAFLAPAYGTVGNVSRDSLRGPGFANWDASLKKTTLIGNRWHAEFRAELFNVLNHTNLSLPNTVVFSSGPTQGTLAQQNTAASYGTPGVVSATANSSRQLQLALKLQF